MKKSSLAADVTFPTWEALRKYLNQLNKEIDEEGQFIKKQNELLSSRYLSTAAGDVFRFDVPSTPGKIIKAPDLSKAPINISTKSLKELKSQYALVEELNRKYRVLEDTLVQIKMNFKDKRDAKDVENSVRVMQQKIQSQLKTIFTFLNKLATEHVPKSFLKYVEAVSGAIKDNIYHSRAANHLYISIDDDGRIVFTDYLLMQEAINAEGQLIPVLYIVIQSVAPVSDDDKIAGTYVYLLHEFEAPQHLLDSGDGLRVRNISNAISAVNKLLELEDFATALGVLPFGPNIDQKVSLDLFSFKDVMDDVKVSDEGMVFVFKQGTTKEIVSKAAAQLLPEVKSMFKKFRAQLRMALGHEGNKPTLEFKLLNVAGPRDLSVYDVEWLKDKFGLSNNDIRKIITILERKSANG